MNHHQSVGIVAMLVAIMGNGMIVNPVEPFSRGIQIVLFIIGVLCMMKGSEEK